MNKKLKILFGLIVFVASLLYVFVDIDTTENNNSYTKVNSSVPADMILTNNLSVICVTGYSSTVRDVSASLKKSIYERDGISYPQPEGTVEVDHIIPLCLGGSNDRNNLFVQFDTPDDSGELGFKEKDRLERYLCSHVCDKEIEIDYAQYRMYSDWKSYYMEIYND